MAWAGRTEALDQVGQDELQVVFHPRHQRPLHSTSIRPPAEECFVAFEHPVQELGTGQSTRS
jgi:hypothetical protein